MISMHSGGDGTHTSQNARCVGHPAFDCSHKGWQSGPGLWETGNIMRTPELTDVGWLGPRYEMDDASHRFGKCSECHEIICVEKAVTDTENTQPETTEMLYKVFRTHVELKHSEGFSEAAARSA
jgi:hypothetical protein